MKSENIETSLRVVMRISRKRFCGVRNIAGTFQGRRQVLLTPDFDRWVEWDDKCLADVARLAAVISWYIYCIAR